MLIYVESKAFPQRTFVVRVQPSDTVARVRAQLLHILYELAREDHQFRLRFKGQYLRDAFTVEDYAIFENAIIKMVPLSKKTESMSDLRSLNSDMDSAGDKDEGIGILPTIKEALDKEIRIFERRERLIYHFKGLLYVHFMAVFFCFLTAYWYSGFWVAVLWIAGVLYCPCFTRQAGYIGGQSIHKNLFCICCGVLSLLAMGASLYMSSSSWIKIVDHGCKDFDFVGDCSHQVVFTGVLHGLHALCLLVSSILAWLLLWNMRVEYGDFVEKYLVQSRDIEEVMKAARQGRVKEKRIAAFELATMAASGDDNKFRIVAEGGLEVLIRLALSKDESTQEHSVEAIAELLTVPAIQDNFVEVGGMKTLSALLHSKSARVVYQCATAISYIVSDSEENKAAVATDHGLEDLSHAAHVSNTLCQRLIAGIFLELAFTPEIRNQMASLNTPALALGELCCSHDHECQRLALQTLELLAIESPDMICAQEELLKQLLRLPELTYDTKVFILAAKILLYYAENRQSCEDLMDQPNCKDSLSRYARTKDPILQKVVVKVVYCMLEVKELKYRAQHLEMDELLRYVRDHAADREAWDMADQALQFMLNEGDEDTLQTLPALSTMEKVHRMNSTTHRPHDAHSSLGSQLSLRSSLADSIADLKKGLD